MSGSSAGSEAPGAAPVSQGATGGAPPTSHCATSSVPQRWSGSRVSSPRHSSRSRWSVTRDRSGARELISSRTKSLSVNRMGWRPPAISATIMPSDHQSAGGWISWWRSDACGDM
ncbi:hypothetical protein SVIO_015200 [Streptomyces violaceusniger]|uniref:Uncharacterized protein n=1 Tax=Streptomyces violaceusniger TaxID=68280 RepID=A0A4D4KWK9_STRVO|nr:hypothetical protein SVIO_015200 [Streptomyces violaceusniger]